MALLRALIRRRFGHHDDQVVHLVYNTVYNTPDRAHVAPHGQTAPHTARPAHRQLPSFGGVRRRNDRLPWTIALPIILLFSGLCWWAIIVIALRLF